MKCLNEVGRSTQGFVEDSKNRISKLRQYHKLAENLKRQRRESIMYNFSCFLNPNDIPNHAEPWKSYSLLYPVIIEA